MSFESIALAAAWIVVLIIVLGVIAPALIPLRRPLRASEAELSYEDDFYDLDGLVIEAEPA